MSDIFPESKKEYVCPQSSKHIFNASFVSSLSIDVNILQIHIYYCKLMILWISYCTQSKVIFHYIPAIYIMSKEQIKFPDIKVIFILRYGPIFSMFLRNNIMIICYTNSSFYV